MRMIAVVDEGGASQAEYRAFFAKIRRQSGADAILVITNGAFTRRGYLAARSKQARAGDFMAAGADGVVEMPLYSVLLPDNVYAFSVTAMLQKLGAVDDVLIPFTGGSAALFDQIAGFLFDEPMAYQRKMRQLRDRGMELDRVLPDILEEFVPGAQRFLQQPANRLAIELYNALRRAYFPARPCLLQRDAAPQSMGTTAAQDAYLLAQVRAAFDARRGQQAVIWARDMFSGSEKTARRVQAALATDCAGFEALSRRARYDGVHAIAVRRHLLGCLIGYRKVDSFVCITYNYVPYIRLLSGSADIQWRLRERASTTLLAGSDDASNVVDVGKRLLLRIDGCAERLYAAARAAD